MSLLHSSTKPDLIDSMDGLSAAACIIAVIQIAQAVGEALKDYYDGVKSAYDDIQRLYQSIKHLEVVLEAIAKIPEDQLSTEMRVSLTDNMGPLLLKRELLSIQTELGDSLVTKKGLSALMKKLEWPFKKKDIEKSVGRINKYKDALLLAFAAENLPVIHLSRLFVA